MAARQSRARGDDTRHGADQLDYAYPPPESSSTHSADHDPHRNNPTADGYEVSPLSSSVNLGLTGPGNHELYERGGPREPIGTRPSLPKLWTPFFLRRPVLISLAATFLGLMVALGILFGVSQRQQGLSTVSPSLYYLWQYGPTAVFTLIATFWGQVEYRSKQLAPWKNMADGPQSADRSLLLDYVSPVSIGVLFRSLKKKDWAVAAAITGTLLIKLVIIASTGLFADNFVHRTIPVTALPVTDRFDPGRLNMSDLHERPIHRIYGVRALNMTFPAGTTAEHAFTTPDTFELDPAISFINATLDVFTSTVQCAPANIDRIDTEIVYGSGGSIMYENGTTGNIPLVDPSRINLTLALSTSSCHYTTQHIVEVGQKFEIPDTTPTNDCQDHGHFLYIYGNTTIASKLSNADKGLVDAQYIICQPQYSILPGNVRLNVNTSANPTAPDISFPSTSNSTQSQKSAINFMQVMVPLLTDDGTFSVVRFLNGSTSQNVTVDYSKNPALLLSSLETYFTEVITQMASIQFRTDAQSTTTGAFDVAEYRLHLQTFSFSVIEALCALLVALSLYLAFRTKNAVVSRDPGPIGGLATIMSRSNRLESTLYQSGSASLDSIENTLRSSRFTTTILAAEHPPAFAISSTVPDLSETKRAWDENTNITWFRPWTMALGARVSLVVLPLLVFAALEVCYKESRRPDGLGQIGPDTWVRLAYTYIPTSILVLGGLSFASLDFTTKLFQPYKALQRGGTRAEATINVDYHGKIGIHALWSAMTLKHISVIAISVAMVASPFLTIAVSGLFRTDILPESTSINVSRQDTFTLDNFLGDPALAAGTGTDQGLTIANLVIMDNITDPQWTSKTLALPKFKLPDGGNAPPSGSILKASVPATRGIANCTLLPTDQIVNATYINGTLGVNSTGEVFLSANSPNKCGRDEFMVFNNKTLDVSIPVINGMYFGQWENTDRRDMDNKTCPTFWIITGQVVDKKPQDVTMLYCSPYLERVQVDVTVTLPDYAIDPSISPAISDSNNTRVGDATMPYQWQHSLYLPFVTDDTANIMNIISDDLTGDGFFGALTQGREGIPITRLAGLKNAPALSTEVDTLYGKVIAQIMNYHRADISNSTATLPTFPATLTTPDRIILRQSPVSTRILDVLLIIMAICAALTYWFLDAAKTLPKNPSSIAAAASLLAGSEMLKTIPPGSEWRSDYSMFSGYFFGLGWWGSGEKRRFGVDIGVGENGGEGTRLI